MACAFPNYKLVHTTRSDYHRNYDEAYCTQERKWKTGHVFDGYTERALGRCLEYGTACPKLEDSRAAFEANELAVSRVALRSPKLRVLRAAGASPTSSTGHGFPRRCPRTGALYSTSATSRRCPWTPSRSSYKDRRRRAGARGKGGASRGGTTTSAPAPSAGRRASTSGTTWRRANTRGLGGRGGMCRSRRRRRLQRPSSRL